MFLEPMKDFLPYQEQSYRFFPYNDHNQVKCSFGATTAVVFTLEDPKERDEKSNGDLVAVAALKSATLGLKSSTSDALTVLFLSNGISFLYLSEL